MKVSKLKGVISTLEVKVPGETPDDPEEVVVVKYKPGALTYGDIEVFEQASESNSLSVIRGVLEPILVSWDLEKEDGSQLGVSGDDFAEIPIQFLGLVMDAIAEDSLPKDRRNAPSNGGSPQTENLEVLPSGTDSSKQPDTSESHPGN